MSVLLLMFPKNILKIKCISVAVEQKDVLMHLKLHTLNSTPKVDHPVGNIYMELYKEGFTTI